MNVLRESCKEKGIDFKIAEIKFWSRIRFVKSDYGECWLIKGLTKKNLYVSSNGNFGTPFDNCRTSWSLYHQKDIPKGFVTYSLCGTNRCCKPSHLNIGVRQDAYKSDLMKKKIIAKRINSERTLLSYVTAAAQFGVSKGYFTVDQVIQKIIYYNQKCYLCLINPMDGFDHVIPKNLKRIDWLANLKPVCNSCNLIKNAKYPYNKQENIPITKQLEINSGDEIPVKVREVLVNNEN